MPYPTIIKPYHYAYPTQASLTRKKLPFSAASFKKKGKRKVRRVPQSQTAALPRHQEEEETDKSKQTQIDQTYEKQED